MRSSVCVPPEPGHGQEFRRPEMPWRALRASWTVADSSRATSRWRFRRSSSSAVTRRQIFGSVTPTCFWYLPRLSA